MQQPETHNNEQCMIQDGTVVNRDNIAVHDTRFSSYKQTLNKKVNSTKCSCHKHTVYDGAWYNKEQS